MRKIRSMWQEGRYYDAWILIHFLSGIVIGFGMLVFNIHIFMAYIAALVILILWEIFEIIENIKEYKENQSIDIVIGILGFVLSFSISPIFIDDFSTPFVSSLIVFFILSIIGWLKYKKYGR